MDGESPASGFGPANEAIGTKPPAMNAAVPCMFPKRPAASAAYDARAAEGVGARTRRGDGRSEGGDGRSDAEFSASTSATACSMLVVGR